MLPRDFKFELVVGGVSQEQIDGELANFIIKDTVPGNNISSFKSLKDKTKSNLGQALGKISGKNDFDIFFETIAQNGEAPKQIKTGSDLNKLFTNRP